MKENIDISNKNIFVIEEYHIDDLSLKLILSNKIKIKATYYFKDEKEKSIFLKYYDLKDKIKINYLFLVFDIYYYILYLFCYHQV